MSALGKGCCAVRSPSTCLISFSVGACSVLTLLQIVQDQGQVRSITSSPTWRSSKRGCQRR